MKLQSHRRNLLANLSTLAGESRATRPVRSWRLRWWIRTGALLSVIGIRRLARTRLQAILLVNGALVFVNGLMVRSSVAFLSGMLMMGSGASDTAVPDPPAGRVQTWMLLHKSRT